MPPAKKKPPTPSSAPSPKPKPKRPAGSSNPLNVYKVQTLQTFFAADLRSVLSQFREPPSASALLKAYNQFKNTRVSQATFRSWLETIGFEYKRTTTLVRKGTAPVHAPDLSMPPPRSLPVTSPLLEDDDEDGLSAILPEPIDEMGDGGFDTPPRMGGGNFEKGDEVQPILNIPVG